MSNPWKIRALVLLAIMIASSLILVNPSLAQSKPSVPEFTVSVADHSYDVPTTTAATTDLDGRILTTTTPGYHMVNGTITISIKNQPFTPYYDSDGYPIKLYYLYVVRNSGNSIHSYPDDDADAYYQASDSAYTTFDYWYSDLGGMSKMTVQVEAFIGHTKTTHIFTPGVPVDRVSDYIIEYVGQSSGWSQPQTVTIPNSENNQITTNPTAAPTQNAPATTWTPQPHQDSTATPSGTQAASVSLEPQFNWLEIALFTLVGVVFAFLLFVILFMHRRIKALQLKQAGV